MMRDRLGSVLGGTALVVCLFYVMTLKGNSAYQEWVESFPALNVVTIVFGVTCLVGGCSLIARGLFRDGHVPSETTVEDENRDEP